LAMGGVEWIMGWESLTYEVRLKAFHLHRLSMWQTKVGTGA
jgi:hypothetical protein